MTFGKPRLKSKKHDKKRFKTDRIKFSNQGFYLTAGGPKDGKSHRLLFKTHEQLGFLKKKQVAEAIISESQGNYYLAVSYKINSNMSYHKFPSKTVGIDLGIKCFATQSDGKKTFLPKKLKKLEKRVSRQQRILSAKQKGSRNHMRAKTKLQKTYQDISNIKKDFLHKYTTWLCKNYEYIAIEKLRVNNMVKNKRLSKDISRGNFYSFRKILEYKTKKFNSKLVVAEQFYPSSKLCSNCGVKKKVLLLSERTYSCDACGYIIDRDLNAALNLEKLIGLTY